MTRAALAVLLLAPLREVERAQIYPGPDAHAMEVLQVDGEENVYVRNDSQHWGSGKIIELGGSNATLQDHVRDVFGRGIDPELIAPQAGLYGLWSSNDKVYKQPRGRNCRVELITGGTLGLDPLSPDETSLHRRLFWRGVLAQAILPVLNSAAGLPISDKLKYQLLLAAVGEALAQNNALYEDLQAAPSAVDKFGVLRNWLTREIDGGGPLAGAIFNIYKWNLLEKMKEKAAREAGRRAAGYVPVLGPAIRGIDIALHVWNWGPTIVGVLNYLYDLGTLPRKLTYSVYFKPGVGDIEPLVVRTNREDKVFTLRGERMNDARRPPTVHFYDRRGNLFWSRPPFDVDARGTSMKVRLEARVLAALDGFITCRVTFGDGPSNLLPDPIRLINQLQITRLVPAEGRPGQQIQIYGDDLSPFTITNRVIFRTSDNKDHRAQVLVAGRNSLTAVVPELDGDAQVRVEESYGGRRLESNALPFKRLPGTLEDHRAESAAGSMPELDYLVEGTLTPAQPRSEHPIPVPPGMDVEVELERLSGPEARPDVFALARWGIGYRWQIKDDPVAWVDVREGPTSLRQPAQRARAGTHGTHGIHPYFVFFERGSGDEIRYRARVRTVRRDDLGSGLDAGDSELRPLTLPVGENQTAHLCGDPGLHHEDREDWYLIPSVPDQERVRVTISDVAPVDKGEARLGGATLYLLRDGDRVPAAESPANFGSTDLPVELRDAGAGERSYLLNVRHGRGLVRYRLGLAIEHVAGPDLAHTPIRSDFNQGTKEGWRVDGDFSPGPSEPTYSHDRRGNGWISAEDPPLISGPLDIAFVVDTTGSMGQAIGSVKQSARDIVAELTRRSGSLRLGTVGYKDLADGAGAIVDRGLSPDVRGRLEELGGWAASGGGSDKPEDALAALETALNFDWRARDERGVEVARVIMLITDASAKADPRRSIASIGALAREKRARIYVLPLDAKDAELARHAEELARGSGGQVLNARSAADTAAVLIGAVERAIDRVSPRYFLAPAKFLGDVSRFQGRTLGFSLRSHSGPARFSAPDVVLAGAGLTLDLVGGLRPHDPTAGFSPPFRRMVVPLGPDGRWIHRAAGRRASADEIKAVLSELRELRIRGEYYAGRDDAALDDVLLGGQEAATDVGMDAVTADWVAVLQARAARLAEREKSQGSAAGDPWVGEFQTKLAAAGVRDASYRSTGCAVGIRMMLTDGGRRSVVSLLFAGERDRLLRNAEWLRRKGTIPSARADELRRGLAALDERLGRLDALLAEAVRQTVLEERASDLLSRDARAIEAHQAAGAALKRLRSDIQGLASTPLIPTLR